MNKDIKQTTRKFLDKLKQYFFELIAIVKSITWPTSRQLIITIFTVVITSVIIGAYLLGLDYLFMKLNTLIIKN